MEWTDWVEWGPETKTDIKNKIENDGYTKNNKRNLFDLCGIKGELQ